MFGATDFPKSVTNINSVVGELKQASPDTALVAAEFLIASIDAFPQKRNSVAHVLDLAHALAQPLHRNEIVRTNED